MKKYTVIFFSFLFISCGSIFSFAQTAGNYAFSTSTGAAAIDPTYTTIIAAGNNDVTSGLRGIGFTFVYEGVNYTQFSANDNALIRLGGTVVSTDNSNGVTDAGDEPKIMPLWDGSTTGNDGGVRFGVSGTSPNQICVIDFRVRPGISTISAYTLRFQVRLYETSNVIEFVYITSASDDPNSASCGIGGTIATNYMARNHVTNHTAASTGAVNSIATWPGNGRMYTFTPPPANPSNPTSNSPQCNTVTITRSGSPPAGETWYWQGTSCGTSTVLGSGATYNATTSGTYYIRSQNISTLIWSAGCGNVAIVINAPTITSQPANASTEAGNGTANFIVTATGTGLTYQWEEYITSWNTIVNGGVYSGATAATLTITNPYLGMNGYKYRCIVSGSCSPSTTSDGNATLTVTYCTPTYTSACGSYHIDNFSFNTLSNTNSDCNGQANNYIYYTPTPTTTVYEGQTYNISMIAEAFAQGFRVWIDYNRNGVFSDAGEDVYNSGSSSTSTFNGTVSIPAGVSAGLTRMRVRSLDGGVPAAGTYCSNLSRGETEDYDITLALCSSINPGTASLTANPITCGQTAQLNLTGETGGSSIQWQDSPDNVVFTDISGATMDPYTTAAQSIGTKYFRAKVTNGGCVVYSNSVTLTVNNIAGGTASLTANPIAHGATAQLNLAGQESGSTFIWQESTDNVVFTDITGATTTPYTTAPQASGTKYFRAKVTKGICIAYSTTVTLTINSGPCGACTRYISGATNTTVLAGEIVCIKFGDTYTGEAQIDGGVLCVDSATALSLSATFSGRFRDGTCATFQSLDEIKCGTVDNKGTISMSTRDITMLGGTFKNSGTITFNKLIMDADLSHSFTNRSGGTLTLVNTGIAGLEMKGTNTPTFTNKSGATVNISVDKFSMDKGVFTNEGVFTVAANGITMNAGTFTNSGTCTISSGSFDKNAGTLTNAGILTLTLGDFLMDGTGTHVTNSGTITLSSGDYRIGSATNTNSPSGIINVNGALNDFIISSGAGNTFTNSGDVNVSDRIDMGISGTTLTNNLTIDANNFVLSTGATLTNNGAGIITLTSFFDASQVTQITNSGTITTGTYFTLSQGPITTSGTINAGTDCNMTQDAIDNSGTINVGNDFEIVQGPLTNTGNMNVTRDFRISQGGPHYNSGCIAVSRNCTLGSTSITINGPADPNKGRFCVGGISEGSNVTFGGTGKLDMCDKGNPTNGPSGGWDVWSGGADNGTHCVGYAAACSNCDAILPVELLSVNAVLQGKTVTIRWSTASEINNDYFSVERSPDAKSFEPIGQVSGAGNSSTIRHYEFADETPLSLGRGAGGEVYYRLKQVDFDGKYEYSPVVSVLLDTEEYFIAYSAAGYVVVSFYAEKDNSAVAINLFDALGKNIFERSGNYSKGIQSIYIPASDFAGGVLFVNMLKENKSYSKKTLVQTQ